ncbi:MAG: ABC transporter permease [Rickettsiaceae bacterium]|nr:ABC transporter permease [Rickettsiaceae bacterium]
MSILPTKNYWKSLYILTEAAIFTQHKNSFLGSAWGIVQPFVHIVIISYVFSFLLNQPTEIFVKNLVASLPLWNFIVNSSSSSARSLTSRSHLLKKVYIKKDLLPVADVAVHCYTLLYSFFAMYLAAIMFYPANFKINIILAPLCVLPVIISFIFIALIFAYITPYIMDTPQIVTVALNAVYWTLPIVYPYNLFPEDKRWIFEINPLFHLIRPMQILVVEGEIPGFMVILKASIVTILVAIISKLVVSRISRNVIYYL